MKKVFLLLLLSLLASACSTHRRTDFTIISSKSFDYTRLASCKRAERAKGDDSAYSVLFVTIGTTELKEAVDNAIESIPGAVALVDGVVYYKSSNFIVGKISSYTVVGTALVDPELAANQTQESDCVIVSYDEKSESYTSSFVSREEFKRVQMRVLDNTNDSFCL